MNLIRPRFKRFALQGGYYLNMLADLSLPNNRIGMRLLRFLCRTGLPVLAVSLFLVPIQVSGYTAGEKQSFQRSIVDYRWRLNPRFKKIKRSTTRYIIVHTSEGGLKSTLRTVSLGKRRRGRSYTYGGHANYVIARDGRTFRTLDKKYRADHAGLSMWNRQTGLSDVSIGIEIVGYHYTPITAKQYRSVGILIKILQDVYDLDDLAVLTHSQIAYGKPNRWVRRLHRGRKRCAKNFERHKAHLGPTWNYDPDVRAGRLVADKKLAAAFYDRRKSVAVAASTSTNKITLTNTAWAIAGEDYNSPNTLYRLPNGRVIAGDKIETKIGWSRLPQQTEVLLNQQGQTDEKVLQTPIKIITNGDTAWSFAGSRYNSDSTFYFPPAGGIKPGTTISDWDDLPNRTRLIVGYRGPYEIKKSKTAYRIAGRQYRKDTTIYYLPPNRLLAGNQIKDFTNLPKGALVFLPQ